MNREERQLLLAIYADCQRLERIGELTEFGEGEYSMCLLLLLMSEVDSFNGEKK